jgi:sulfatase modifying factor 1
MCRPRRRVQRQPASNMLGRNLDQQWLILCRHDAVLRERGLLRRTAKLRPRRSRHDQLRRGRRKLLHKSRGSGGTFFRAYDPSGSDGGVELAADGGPSDETHPATVSSFRLDKYEVTVGRFRQFVNAWNAGWVPAPASGKHAYLNDGNGLNAVNGGYEPGWIASDDCSLSPTDLAHGSDPVEACTWTPLSGVNSPNENLPIDCIDWYEAYAFCIWDGGFLPSEAEWEYAAAGGDQQREYPWGPADPGTGNAYAVFNCNSFIMDSGSPCMPLAVGWVSMGVGRWGQLDLAGNVYEWILDWQQPCSVCDAPYDDPCVDCAMFNYPSSRIIRGGFYSTTTQRQALSELRPPMQS